MIEKNKPLPLMVTNEILAAFLSDIIQNDTQEFQSNASQLINEKYNDARQFIKDKYNIDLLNHDLQVVENSPTFMHLILPFYGGVEKLRQIYESKQPQYKQATCEEEDITLNIGDNNF